MSDRESMTPSRFVALLDAYGADPARWPDAEVAAARALLERSAEARAQRDEAAALDAALDALPATTPSPALTARILAAAPAARGARPRLAWSRPPQRAAARRMVRYLAAAAPVAAAAGLALWLTRTPEVVPAPPAPDVVAEVGSYSLPGDELLTVTEVEFLPGDPWSECSEDGLGCLDLGELDLDSLSGSATRRDLS
jgi:hypothetical protein